MTNLRTDEMVFFRNLTKIDTDENKAIYSIPLAATKSKLAIFSIKVTVKVTRLLTLVSFGRVSLVEYACQI